MVIVLLAYPEVVAEPVVVVLACPHPEVDPGVISVHQTGAKYLQSQLVHCPFFH